MDPMPSERAIKDAVLAINNAAKGGNLEREGIAKLNSALSVLALNVLGKTPNYEQLGQVREGLKSLISRTSEHSRALVEDRVGNAAGSAHVLSGKGLEDSSLHRLREQALFLINKMGAVSLPEEVRLDQAFHGKAMETAEATIRELLYKDPKASFSIQKEVRTYCEREFNRTDPHLRRSQFLIRPSSKGTTKGVDGTQKDYFVISRRKAGSPEIETVLAWREKNSKNETLWHVQGYEPVQDFSTLRNIVSFGYDPLPLAGERTLKQYVRLYTSVECTSDDVAVDAEDNPEAWDNDVIFKELQDPISLGRIKDAVITPEGHTYSRDGIVHWLNDHAGIAPQTRTELRVDELKPNVLVGQLVEARIRQFEEKDTRKITELKDWKNDPILQFFADPLNGELMTGNLVLAPDGNTYDREKLMEYLKQHNYRLPGGQYIDTNHLVLIPNRMAENVLRLRLEKFRGQSY